MEHTITVTHVAGDQFNLDIRGHHLTVDQPKDDPGLEGGPTPVELFVAALASCAAHSAQLVVTRVAPTASVSATCAFEMSKEPPWRVDSVHTAVVLPSGLSPDRLAAIRRAVDQCTVHRSLLPSPEVAVTLVSQSVTVPTIRWLNADAAAILEPPARPALPAGRGRRELQSAHSGRSASRSRGDGQ